MARTKATAAKETAVKDEVVKETAPKKTTAKKAAAKTAEAVEAKPEEVKAEEVKEEAPKKAPAKKAAVKKAAEPETTVTIQFQGKDIGAAEVVEKAKAAFAQMNPDSEIKTVDVYVKPDEGVAYYAVNGEGSADYKIEL